MNKKKLTLEQRIARLEKLIIMSEARSSKCEGFEANADEAGARREANRMAKKFSAMTGIPLHADPNHDTVDSPMYGWSHNDVDALADDPDARYTFMYNVPGELVSVYMRPSDGTVWVWKSIGSNDTRGGEGAVDPRTGECEWCEEMEECSYPLSAWKNFGLDMIHGDDEDWDEDDEFESYNRRRQARRR